MTNKFYLLFLHIVGVMGVLFVSDWALKKTGVIDRKYTVSIGGHASVGFADVGDYVEIYNYEGEPFLYKAIALFVDGEIINITKIQTTADHEKGIEIFFDTYSEGKLVTVVHEDRDGIPPYRYVRGEDGRPRKEYLAEIVWNNEPVERREEVAGGAVE